MPTFYFDSASFLTARTLYTNPTLTSVAPDGWYTSCGYAREVSGGGGLLGPLISCSDINAGCVAPCQSDPLLTISPTANTQGVFDTQIDVSQKVGAIRVEMNITSTNTIVGFFCQLGADTYPNSLNRRQFKSRTAVGALSKPYVIGSTGDTCNASGNIISGLKWYKRSSSGAWILQTPLLSEYITGGDIVAATTTLVMFVPKPNPVPSILNTRIIQPCSSPGTNNNTMKISCPDPLFAVNCSSVSTTATGGGDPACPKALTKPLYHGQVSGVVGVSFAVSDWVFSDANSVNIPLDGYYKTAYVSGVQNQWIQVAGGIVTNIGLCP